jgi:hypothetical protein
MNLCSQASSVVPFAKEVKVKKYINAKKNDIDSVITTHEKEGVIITTITFRALRFWKPIHHFRHCLP